jgi:hypothetical protein
MKEGRRLRQPLLFALRYQPPFMNFMSDGLSVVFGGQALHPPGPAPKLNGQIVHHLLRPYDGLFVTIRDERTATLERAVDAVWSRAPAPRPSSNGVACLMRRVERDCVTGTASAASQRPCRDGKFFTVPPPEPKSHRIIVSRNNGGTS